MFRRNMTFSVAGRPGGPIRGRVAPLTQPLRFRRNMTFIDAITPTDYQPCLPMTRPYLLCEAALSVRAQNLRESIGPSDPGLALFR
jgi:hypothetical protein